MNYFFVHAALGGLQSVAGDVLGHAEAIGTFSKKIFSRLKNRTFSFGNFRNFLLCSHCDSCSILYIVVLNAVKVKLFRYLVYIRAGGSKGNIIVLW